MGCFVILFALIGPRVALVFTAIFSNVISRAIDSWVVAFLGFCLLPWTTLSYVWMWDWGSNGVHGIEWFLVVLAFLFDVASYGFGRNARNARDAPV